MKKCFSEWYIWVLILCVGFLFICVPLKVYSKISVCKTYYTELDIVSCFFSDYGLPARSSK